MSDEPITIKRYANRRPYSPEVRQGVRTVSLTVSLGELGATVEADEDFVVREVAPGDDIKSFVLKQIILGRANHG